VVETAVVEVSAVAAEVSVVLAGAVRAGVVLGVVGK
jgi:hypothetical protein